MTELYYPYQETPEPGTTIEVLPGIHWLRMPMPGSLNHINLYALADPAGWTLIDTGLGDTATATHWDHLLGHALSGFPVQRIIVTHMHPDHVGQAGYLSERCQAPLYMTRGEYFQARAFEHGGGNMTPSWIAESFYRGAGLTAADLERMRASQRASGGYGSRVSSLPIGFERLQHGDLLTIGGNDWQVLTGSGHSPEHACLYSRKLGVMIAGDQVLPVITSNVSVHPTEPSANPLKDWLESHDRFLALPDETLVLPAHGEPFRGLRKRLRALIAHHEDRMLALEEFCERPATAISMLPMLFRRKLDERQLVMALGECIAHLHLLMHRDRIARDTDRDGIWRFRSIDPDLARRRRSEHDHPDDSPMLV